MKKKFIFFTMLLLTLMGGVKLNVLNAQEETVVIGDGSTSTDRTPICNNNYKYSISQLLYTSAEIQTGPCTIKSISFKQIQGAGNVRELEIYMLNTDLSYFPASGGYVNLSNEDLVYHNTIALTAVDNWIEIELTNPFEYDGRNLLICVNDKTGQSVTGTYDYDKFYTYVESENLNRCIYSRNDNKEYDPSNISNESYSSVTQTNFTTWETSYYNNQIKLKTGPSAPAVPTVETTSNSINLGEVRMGDYWTEKIQTPKTFDVTFKNTTLTSISCNNDFFEVSYGDLTNSPVTVSVTYKETAEATGEQTGNITITSTDADPIVVAVTATPYDPAQGDVFEEPIEVAFTDNAFTHTATGMHDDYILPDEENDGNNGDAVYTFELAKESLITANVEGTKPIVAIYNSDFGGEGGPSSDNNNEGGSNEPAEPSAPTTFGPYTFDSADELSNNFVNNGSGWDFYCYPDLDIEGDIYVKSGADWMLTKEKYFITSTSKLSFVLAAYSGFEIAVCVSENSDGSNLEELQTTYGSNGTHEADLSTFKNRSVYIGFKVKTLGYGGLLDDLALTDGSAKSRSLAQTRSTNQIDRVLYPAGTYYLVAAAEDDFKLNLSISDLTAPAAATLTAPANEAEEQTNPLLTWTLDKLAEKYQLLLGKTNPPTDVVVDWSDPATSYQTNGLANNTVYYWQVKSRNSVGETSSEVFYFVTPLNKPTNVAASKTNLYPGDETTITWTPAAGATSYNVYVGETKVNVDSEVTGTSYTLSDPKYLVYNVNPGHNVTVTANHTLGESAKSDAVVVKMTGYNDITGTITNGAGATLRFTGTDEFGKPQTFTKVLEDDQYTMEDVLAGTYTVTASKFYYQDLSEQLEVIYAAYPITFDSEMTACPAADASLLSNVAVTEVDEKAQITWTGANDNTQMYNIYRRNVETGDVELVAEEQNNTDQISKSYIDADYATSEVEDGKYQYGVTTMLDDMITVLNESFDNNDIPAEWIKGGSGGISSVSGYYHSARYGYYMGNDQYQLSSLTTSEIDLSGYVSAPTLSMYYKNGSGNTFKIYAKVSGGDQWTLINTISSYINNYTQLELTLSDTYKGKTIQIMFECSKGNAFTCIDDIVIKASKLQESAPVWSNTIKKGGIVFTNKDGAGDGKWETAENWKNGNAPTLNDGTEEVTIKASATISSDVNVKYLAISGGSLTLESTAVLTADELINNNESSFIINDGAQLFQNNANVSATFNMGINIPDAWSTDHITTGWQFIAAPFTDAKTSSFKPAEGDFDLYKYDGTQEYEWVNYKDNQPEGSTFFYDFADGMQGWTSINANADNHTWGHTEDGTGPNFEYGTPGGFNPDNYDYPYGSGYDDVKGALYIDAFYYDANWDKVNLNPDDYVVSPEKVVIVDGSRLKFWLRAASSSSINNEIFVYLSTDDEVSVNNLELIHTVETLDNYWLQVNVDLSAYAGEEVWIIIRRKATDSMSTYVLVDNLELTNGTTRNSNEEFFELTFQQGRGYLASYETLEIATLSGTLNNATSFTKELSYNEGNDLANFHLLGNPFTFDMDMTQATFNNLVNGVAIVNNEGGYTYDVTSIPVGDGFFVKATKENPSFSYNAASKATRGEKANSLNITATSNAGNDNVVINFAGEQEGFPKMRNFNDAIATVYVQDKGANYGIYNCDENTTEVELCFNANQMGNYTISIEPNGKFQTVTLVDRFTGIETNMLLEDYSFTAMSEENNNRFIIKMVNGQQTTDNSHFVFQSGEDLIIDAEGTVQIIDVMGRVVYNNDVTSDNNRINVSDFNNGAYVVRVINESEIKVEKVVIY